jgi:transcription elongation factor Elf1
LIIIAGTRGRETEIGTGAFYCPRCQTERGYVRKRVGTYFTLFFIPIVRVKDHGEFIECQTCHQKYELTVLDYQPAVAPVIPEMDRLRVSIRRDLDAGMPLQMAQQKLVNEGIHDNSADHTVTVAAGAGVRTCPACGMRYVRTVERCTSCGAGLVTHGG